METEDSIIRNVVDDDGNDSIEQGADFDVPTDVHVSPFFEKDFIADMHRLLANAYRALRGNRPDDAATYLEEAERVRTKGIEILGREAIRLGNLGPVNGDMVTLLRWTDEMRMLSAWLRREHGVPDALRMETRRGIDILISLNAELLHGGRLPQVPCLLSDDGQRPPDTTGELLDWLLVHNLVPHDIAVILCMQLQARLEGYDRLVKMNPPLDLQL
jgi:hypothetical protein